MIYFKDKIAVITGAASGIGFALARAAASRGMKVAMADVNQQQVERSAEQLDKEFPNVETLPINCDVTNSASVKAMADKIFALWSEVHLLFNNAGVYPTPLESWKQPLRDWRWLMDVNVFGIIHGIHHFSERMIAQKEDGAVINTVSLAGFITAPYVAPYYASKHAAMAISECLEYELRAANAKIHVTTINPGWVNTNLLDARREHPDQSAAPVDLQTEQARARDAAIQQMVSNAISPDLVAQKTFEAIAAKKFHVFPEPERKSEIEKRFREVMEDRNPVWPKS
jgi:NAD(P)-dependent dehydrogenase (short-subunit alcohol dehydrogenase family)